MSSSDGAVVISTEMDNSGIEKDIKKIKPSLEKSADSAKELGDGLSTAGKKGADAAKSIRGSFDGLNGVLGDLASTIGISFGVNSLVSFGREAVSLASDIQEVQNVVDTSFGSMSNQVEDFSQNSIEQFGMSELAAKQTAGRYMAMTTSMGITGQAATDMALNVAGLTGDMSSFYNVSQDVASTALASIWTGETESLKQFGIVMTQTNLEAFAMSQGINKTWDQLTQAEQVQLRYNYVLSQTSLAQGDFAKTSDSWANQNRILSETTNALSASIGEGLMDSMTPLLEVVNDVVSSLYDFQESTGLLDDFFTILISGAAGLLTYKVADAIAGVTVSIMEMGGAAMIANMQGGLAAISFGALVAVLVKLANSWGSMNDGEKVIAVLGAVAAAALTAALAVGAFQSALTMGIAAAAIVAGIAAIMIAINSANSRMAKFKNLDSMPTLADARLPKANVPHLATGAVIPPNREFMAVLGDQKHGTNIEAPVSEIESAVTRGIAAAGGGSPQQITVVMELDRRQIGRVVYDLNKSESQRVGISLVNK